MQGHAVWGPLLLLLGITVVSWGGVTPAEARAISCTVANAAECASQLAAGKAGQAIQVQGVVQSGQVPTVWLPKSAKAATAADWQLSISRMVLLDVELSAAPTAPSTTRDPAVPALWPLNAFQSVGTSLLLQDVRLVTRSSAAFQQYLSFFSAQPALQSSVNTTLHTDGRTFVHVVNWASASTILESVTLMTGPCMSLFDQQRAAGGALTQTLTFDNSTDMGSNQMAVALVSGGSGSGNGCNVFTASNETLLPLLLDQGTLVGREMLLVLLQANVSIGHQRQLQQQTPPGRVKFGRPVAFTGFWSVRTGIDFLMVPNTLDVTAPLARVAFNSLVLENNPTGDVTTTLVAAPFSPIASVNLYSVFCSRAIPSKPCAVLNNVTLVISSQTEFDYIGYMYTMFNSQAPGAKQLTLFYSQDLLFTSLNFTVGPGPDSITIFNATSAAWRLLNTVYSLRPVLAPPLPLPAMQYVDFEVSKAAPLALQVFNCADLKAGLQYRTIPSRLHMLLMRKSFSLARSSTPEASSIQPPPTQDLPNLVDGPSSVNMMDWPPPEPSPTCLGERALVAYRTQIQGLLHDQPIVLTVPEVQGNGSLAHSGFPTLSFAYTRNGLILPGELPGQLTFQNLFLRELPQGGTPSELIESAQLPYRLPPEAWTLLIWPVNSTLSQRALRLRNTAMVLPEPEYKHLAAMARLSKAFVIELAGHPDALTFKDTMQHVNHMHVVSFEGPGIMGENVTFLPDPDAAASLSRLSTYWWPSNYQPLVDRPDHAVQQARQGSQAATLLPAVLVLVVVVLAVAAVVAGVLLRRRHQQQLQQLRSEAVSSSQVSDKPLGPPGRGADVAASYSQSNLSSSRRSSKDVSRAAGSSCAASATDTCELRIDVDQLAHQQGVGPYGGHSAGLQQHDRGRLPSPGHGWHGGMGASSPRGDQRVPLYGFFPVIEGVPAGDAGATASSSRLVPPPLPPVPRCPSSSSSHGRASNSRASSQPRLQASPTSSSSQSLQHTPPQQQQQLLRTLSPAGAATGELAPLTAAATSSQPAGAQGSTVDLVSTVATGLEKWRVAVSTTTMQLAQRRLAEQQASAMSMGALQQAGTPDAKSRGEPVPATSFSSSCCQEDKGLLPHSPGAAQSQQQQGGQARATGAQLAQQQQSQSQSLDTTPNKQGSADRLAAANANSLLLKRVLGRSSFGQVWLGVWRGIPVAVKVMHLPTDVLVDQQEEDQQQQQQPEQQSGAAQVVPPHFAVMEAVLSSQCSHPNVVQVYQYMLTPLLTSVQTHNSDELGTDGSLAAATVGQLGSQVPTVVGEPGLGSKATDVMAAAAAAAAAAAEGGTSTLSGWELKLILELCDEGTLRSALDRAMFKAPGAAFMEPLVAMLLARDVAAALLHLHSEGVIHADLKAANVMLATGGPDPHGIWGQTIGRRLVAKVADFGLAISLGPNETHASLTARGTPTHMSPETFMSGRISKACDSYAFGILLYELVTSQRAFAGVPLPLLPHEVAVKGLRPAWPQDAPTAFRPLQRLAEACWVAEPERRPVFSQVLEALDHWVQGDAAFHPAWLGPQPPATQPPAAQQQAMAQRRAEAAAAQDAHGQHREQQQQQHRQWRHTVRHTAAASGADSPVTTAAWHGAAGQGAVAQGNAAPRAGQLDWSEVSFGVQPASAHRPPTGS